MSQGLKAILDDIDVGDVLEVDGLFEGICDRSLVLSLKQKNEFSWVFELSYVGIYLCEKEVKEVGGKLVWI